MVHTHAPQRRGRWNDNESEMNMKMKWKLLNHGREEGNAKEEGKREHQHNTPGPERANPEKAREEKTEADGNGTRPAKEGEDGSAWTNLPQRNLNLPPHTQDPNLLGEGKDTWKKETNGD